MKGGITELRILHFHCTLMFGSCCPPSLKQPNTAVCDYTPLSAWICLQAFSSQSSSIHLKDPLPPSLCSWAMTVNAKGRARASQRQFYQLEIVHEAFKTGQQEEINNGLEYNDQTDQRSVRKQLRHLFRGRKPGRKGSLKAQIPQHSILALHCYMFPWDSTAYIVSLWQEESIPAGIFAE